ncbi:MAG: 4-hydroxy-3-methylbut-2-enyl diphosphate reductase [Clostridia bacterium]|nr:4-hydroxy-3-methylbut-2-enyl diphosphate reductase [Clostridia bacterium]
MKITVAKHAGFCFGVKRATEKLEHALTHRREGESLLTLGDLIHNEVYNASLRSRGVRSVTEAELEEVLSRTDEAHPATLFVRAHGCTAETEERLRRMAQGTPFFAWEDCTCPYVKKIHRIVEGCDPEEQILLLLGAREHPEVVGILSRFAGDKLAFDSPEELECAISQDEDGKLHKKVPVLVAQTTQKLGIWHQSQKKLKKLYTNSIIFDTICSVTESRQTEAEALSKVCDGAIVIGGRASSNTAKLYEICRRSCANTVLISSAKELEAEHFSGCDHVVIVAGASTPGDEIEEVYKTMSEMHENVEQMLNAQQCTTLNTGDVVTGTVTHVSDAELQLDVGAGVTGYIKADQISNDPAFKLTENFKNGDQVEAFVIRVSDIEGVAELSKKRADADKNWQTIVAACEEEQILEGKVAEAVKGGVVIYANANRVFIPASQTGVPKDGDLSTLVGTTVQFKVLEIKGKKAVGSIRKVQREIRRAQEADFWANIEVGKVYNGTVKSMTTYGAFVDLGGVDGMVHVTELSWKHIKNPAEVVSIGDPITVFVKSFDPEKKRISLGYKTEETNPWNIFKSQYAVGDIASVKIVSMMPFGAFAEIIDGVDGLIHISQIAMQRIAKPADLLEIGQIVDTRITDIDDEKQKVSLSIRALLEEAAAAAEAMPEDYAEEAPADEQ